MQKDPTEKLDYAINWDLAAAGAASGTGVLASGETISTSTWVVPPGITHVSDTLVTPVATVWLSGGTDGQWYQVSNHIVTSQGREFQRSINIQVINR